MARRGGGKETDIFKDAAGKQEAGGVLGLETRTQRSKVQQLT